MNDFFDEPELTFNKANQKYTALKSRAFKSYLDIFLISSYISNKDLSVSATLETYKSFDYNDKRISKANKAFQLSKDADNFIGSPLRDLDNAIEKWHLSNDIEPFKEFFLANRIISWENFKMFYESDNPYANEGRRFCHYCNLSEGNLESYVASGKIKTKRLSTRGRDFEIDRIVPFKGYTKDNIVLACYWCNNAKTDEFTYEEFLPIGKQIQRVWVKRFHD
jgi:hypothetical protein